VRSRRAGRPRCMNPAIARAVESAHFRSWVPKGSAKVTSASKSPRIPGDRGR
jgi:hypothetical protein